MMIKKLALALMTLSLSIASDTPSECSELIINVNLDGVKLKDLPKQSGVGIHFKGTDNIVKPHVEAAFDQSYLVSVDKSSASSGFSRQVPQDCEFMAFVHLGDYLYLNQKTQYSPLSRDGKTYVVIDIHSTLPETLTYVVLTEDQYKATSSTKKTVAASMTVTALPLILERQPYKKPVS